MSITKDQLKGRVAEAKNKTNEVAGKVVGNQTLEAKGKVQETLSARLKRSLARSGKTWRTQRSTPDFTPLF